MDWEKQFSERAHEMRSSIIRDMLALTEQSDVISFGGGFPGPEIFPIKKFKEACEKVLDQSGRIANDRAAHLMGSFRKLFFPIHYVCSPGCLDGMEFFINHLSGRSTLPYYCSTRKVSLTPAGCLRFNF